MKLAGSIPYRNEIDGLRAWAVLLVVFYHAGLTLVPGGYMGVDVFFVISGYLITRIAVTEKEQGHFSILHFYERRLRRIIPALVVVVVAVLAFGAIWILPQSLERISSSALSTMLFYANVHFWIESSNYFAPASATDPLLHTWSLAVEEQFYLFLPPLFALVFTLGRRVLIAAMIGACTASFAVAIIAYDIAPTATFFLPVTRAWEFLFGSVLAMRCLPAPPNRPAAELGTVLGLGAILFGAVGFDSTMPFPGWVTLFPVIGTALVIYFSEQSRTAANLFLRWGPLRKIGLISYSLYLWHWPIFVLSEHYVLLRPLNDLEAALCIGLSFIAAALSYRFVEQVFRRKPFFQGPGRLLAALVPAIAIALLLAVSMIQSNGLSGRYPDFGQFDMASQLEEEGPLHEAHNEDCFLREVAGNAVAGCHLGPRGATNTLIWGDSFAQHYLTALLENADADPLPGNRGLISLVSPACPPIIGYDPASLPACKAINEQAIELMGTMQVDTVILSANWFNYGLVNRVRIEDIRSTVTTLKARGIRVVLIGQSPVFTFISPQEALYRQVLDDVSPAMLGRFPNIAESTLNEQMRQAVPADLFVDPSAYLCSGKECQFHSDEGYLFSDYGHLTLLGARYVARPLLGRLRSEAWNAPD